MPISTPKNAQESYGTDQDHFIHVAEYIFRPAVERAGYEFCPPSVTSSDVIQAEIIRNLETADLVLCDMTLWNANVFFELGIRVALDRPVALVKDSLTEGIPFDNALASCHTYDPRMDPWCLSVEIPKLREFIEAAGKQQQNALWRYFGITQRASRTDPGNPESAKLDVLLAEVAALRAETAELRAPKPHKDQFLWAQLSGKIGVYFPQVEVIPIGAPGTAVLIRPMAALTKAIQISVQDLVHADFPEATVRFVSTVAQ